MASSERSGWVEVLGSGAAGVGTVLVLLPLMAVVLCMGRIDDSKSVGLPVLAILGIMILLGTLSLVAMLFRRLELADPSQPLALPQGSMRAVIALSLIVLFAIISITLYRSQSKGGDVYQLRNLSEDARNALALESNGRVQGVLFDRCAEAGAAVNPATVTPEANVAPDQAASAAALEARCPVAQRRYAVTLRTSATPESTDLAKQLLVLIGTLMTSLTSYYFAARSKSEDMVANKTTVGAPTVASPSNALQPQGVTPIAAHQHDEADGCDVEIVEVTHDEDLPPTTGGVAGDTAGTKGA